MDLKGWPSLCCIILSGRCHERGRERAGSNATAMRSEFEEAVALVQLNFEVAAATQTRIDSESHTLWHESPSVILDCPRPSAGRI